MKNNIFSIQYLRLGRLRSLHWSWSERIYNPITAMEFSAMLGILATAYDSALHNGQGVMKSNVFPIPKLSQAVWRLTVNYTVEILLVWECLAIRIHEGV